MMKITFTFLIYTATSCKASVTSTRFSRFDKTLRFSISSRLPQLNSLIIYLINILAIAIIKNCLLLTAQTQSLKQLLWIATQTPRRNYTLASRIYGSITIADRQRVDLSTRWASWRKETGIPEAHSDNNSWRDRSQDVNQLDVSSGGGQSVDRLASSRWSIAAARPRRTVALNDQAGRLNEKNLWPRWNCHALCISRAAIASVCTCSPRMATRYAIL